MFTIILLPPQADGDPQSESAGTENEALNRASVLAAENPEASVIVTGSGRRLVAVHHSGQAVDDAILGDDILEMVR